MTGTRYRITCLQCQESDIHTIDESSHQVLHSEKILLTPILSFRFRGDNQWGFRCKCGNDNRLAASELKDFDKLVGGDPISVQQIKDSLKIPDGSQFKMERV